MSAKTITLEDKLVTLTRENRRLRLRTHMNADQLALDIEHALGLEQCPKLDGTALAVQQLAEFIAVQLAGANR